MRLVAMAVVGVSAVVVSMAPGGGVRQTEDIFRGGWLVKSAAQKAKPTDSQVGDTFTFEGSGVQIKTKAGKVLKGIFKNDPTRKPQSFDMIITKGGEEKLYGVYEFAGATLRLVYATDPAHRPSELRSEPTQNWTELVLVRVHD